MIAVICVCLGTSLLATTKAGQQVLHTLRYTLGWRQSTQPQRPRAVTTVLPGNTGLAVGGHQQEPVAPHHITPPRRPSLVAIVIDDLGWDLHAAQALLDLDIPLSFAILPQTPHQLYIAREAQRRGRDILLHLPMEPHGYPHVDPGQHALLSHMNAHELVAHIEAAMQVLPAAIGVNNHMGSRLTENYEAMRVLMRQLKQHNLFFLDSRTSLSSLAYRAAREIGIRAGQRHVFLDNDVGPGKITQQLYHLASLADTYGSAIGIGHPYPETLQALQQTLPALRRSGVEIVPVSHLVD